MKKQPRCGICGRIIGASEFDRDEIKVDFVPDTERTVESTTFTHKRCE